MSDQITLVRSQSLYSGAPYASAALAPPGSRLLVLAGSCPIDQNGSTIGIGDYVTQAAAVLDNLEAALADAGASLTDVLGTRVLVATTQRADLTAVWDVVAARFGSHDVPSTLVGVTVLGYPDQLVEVEAIAAVL